MMTLPLPPRKAFLRSMWLVSNITAALVVGFVVALLFGRVWLVPTAVLFIGFALLGYRWTSVQIRVYTIWNRFAARVNRVGYRWILLLSHRVLLRAIGPEGSKFDAGAKSSVTSRWSGYSADYGSARSSDKYRAIEEVARGGWIRHYFQWARTDGNRWAVLLLPFFMSLALFRQEEESGAAPENIYTLF